MLIPHRPPARSGSAVMRRLIRVARSAWLGMPAVAVAAGSRAAQEPPKQVDPGRQRLIFWPAARRPRRARAPVLCAGARRFAPCRGGVGLARPSKTFLNLSAPASSPHAPAARRPCRSMPFPRRKIRIPQPLRGGTRRAQASSPCQDASLPRSGMRPCIADGTARPAHIRPPLLQRRQRPAAPGPVACRRRGNLQPHRSPPVRTGQRAPPVPRPPRPHLPKAIGDGGRALPVSPRRSVPEARVRAGLQSPGQLRP